MAGNNTMADRMRPNVLRFMVAQAATDRAFLSRVQAAVNRPDSAGKLPFVGVILIRPPGATVAGGASHNQAPAPTPMGTPAANGTKGPPPLENAISTWLKSGLLY